MKNSSLSWPKVRWVAPVIVASLGVVAIWTAATQSAFMAPEAIAACACKLARPNTDNYFSTNYSTNPLSPSRRWCSYWIAHGTTQPNAPNIGYNYFSGAPKCGGSAFLQAAVLFGLILLLTFAIQRRFRDTNIIDVEK